MPEVPQTMYMEFNSNDKTFDLETRYLFFLSLMKMEESKMPDIQRRQLREAFFGGLGMMLVLLTQELPKYDKQKDCNDIIESLWQQVLKYWDSLTPKN